MSDMVEQARRIVADPQRRIWHNVTIRQIAEALLAEHDARQEAEADSMEQAQIVARLGAQVDSLTARAEQAERERDAAARFGESTQDWLRARVATLEAALRDLVDELERGDSGYSQDGMRRLSLRMDAARAALGEQDTTPPDDEYGWMTYGAAAPQGEENTDE